MRYHADIQDGAFKFSLYNRIMHLVVFDQIVTCRYAVDLGTVDKEKCVCHNCGSLYVFLDFCEFASFNCNLSTYMLSRAIFASWSTLTHSGQVKFTPSGNWTELA